MGGPVVETVVLRAVTLVLGPVVETLEVVAETVVETEVVPVEETVVVDTEEVVLLGKIFWIASQAWLCRSSAESVWF